MLIYNKTVIIIKEYDNEYVIINKIMYITKTILENLLFIINDCCISFSLLLEIIDKNINSNILIFKKNNDFSIINKNKLLDVCHNYLLYKDIINFQHIFINEKIFDLEKSIEITLKDEDYNILYKIYDNIDINEEIHFLLQFNEKDGLLIKVLDIEDAKRLNFNSYDLDNYLIFKYKIFIKDLNNIYVDVLFNMVNFKLSFI